MIHCHRYPESCLFFQVTGQNLLNFHGGAIFKKFRDDLTSRIYNFRKFRADLISRFSCLEIFREDLISQIWAKFAKTAKTSPRENVFD